MDDDEVRILARLLEPYRAAVIASWGGSPPTPGPGHVSKSSTLLTVPEAAEDLRCSEMSVYRLISAGSLPTVDIATGKERPRTRIPRKQLEEYIAKRTEHRPVRRTK